MVNINIMNADSLLCSQADKPESRQSFLPKELLFSITVQNVMRAAVQVLLELCNRLKQSVGGLTY